MTEDQKSELRYLVEFESRYVVSDQGNVYSLFSSHGPRARPKKIKPTRNPHGYMMTHLKTSRGRRGVFVHRLVASAFLGVSVNDRSLQIHHVNEIRDDNRLSNLRPVTRAENMRIAARDGRLKRRIGWDAEKIAEIEQRGGKLTREEAEEW